jgi:hypothetical protein
LHFHATDDVDISIMHPADALAPPRHLAAHAGKHHHRGKHARAAHDANRIDDDDEGARVRVKGGDMSGANAVDWNATDDDYDDANSGEDAGKVRALREFRSILHAKGFPTKFDPSMDLLQVFASQNIYAEARATRDALPPLLWSRGGGNMKMNDTGGDGRDTGKGDDVDDDKDEDEDEDDLVVDNAEANETNTFTNRDEAWLELINEPAAARRRRLAAADVDIGATDAVDTAKLDLGIGLTDARETPNPHIDVWMWASATDEEGHALLTSADNGVQYGRQHRREVYPLRTARWAGRETFVARRSRHRAEREYAVYGGSIETPLFFRGDCWHNLFYGRWCWSLDNK